ncbi:arginase family-domain-containing protein [Usnea florida]
MRMLNLLLTVMVLAPFASAYSFYDNPEQDPLPPTGPESDEELHRKWDFEWGFSGISTFAHLKHVKCLSERKNPFDIGIIGAPFDTAVSYRPGARFGPRAIRAASARQTSFRGFNPRRGLNPYTSPYTIIDCGDIPVTPFDNALALHQMTSAFLELGSRSPAFAHSTNPKPKLLTLGGDHSIALAALRALNELYGGPIAVLHFDAHLDTWHPAKYPSAWPSAQSDFTHGSMFWIASNEGLILNGSSAHAGLRSRLSGWDDYEDDERQGFLRISADDIDEMGTAGIVSAILERIGTDTPTYLSLDIDVLDPGLCPGTGTPEAGGWTSREVIRILRGLEALNVVGADIVEVAPAYDGVGEQTALVAAQVGFEILTSWVGRGMSKIDKSQRSENGKDEL